MVVIIENKWHPMYFVYILLWCSRTQWKRKPGSIPVVFSHFIKAHMRRVCWDRMTVFVLNSGLSEHCQFGISVPYVKVTGPEREQIHQSYRCQLRSTLQSKCFLLYRVYPHVQIPQKRFMVIFPVFVDAGCSSCHRRDLEIYLWVVSGNVFKTLVLVNH